jgi:uncharacterized phage-like protein YoqJ
MSNEVVLLYTLIIITSFVKHDKVWTYGIDMHRDSLGYMDYTRQVTDSYVLVL